MPETKRYKVKDVIEKLQQFPPDMSVIYCVDDEGNEYNEITFLPNILKIRSLKGRFLETVDEGQKGINVVCLN